MTRKFSVALLTIVFVTGWALSMLFAQPPHPNDERPSALDSTRTEYAAGNERRRNYFATQTAIIWPTVDMTALLATDSYESTAWALTPTATIFQGIWRNSNMPYLMAEKAWTGVINTENARTVTAGVTKESPYRSVLYVVTLDLVTRHPLERPKIIDIPVRAKENLSPVDIVGSDGMVLRIHSVDGEVYYFDAATLTFLAAPPVSIPVMYPPHWGNYPILTMTPTR